MKTASAMIASGLHRRILIVSAEQGSVCRDFEHPESAVLIGDGAGAAVLRPLQKGSRANHSQYFSTYPSGAHLAELRGCGTRAHPNDPNTVPADNLFRMNGLGIYKLAFRKVAKMVDELLSSAGLTQKDIDLVVLTKHLVQRLMPWVGWDLNRNGW